MLNELGLPTGLDYLYEKYYDNFVDGDSEDFEGYLDYLIEEAESYKKEQKNQSIEKRLERLKEGLCPIHGYGMAQLDGWSKDEDGRNYTITGCPVDNCVHVKAFGWVNGEERNCYLSGSTSCGRKLILNLVAEFLKKERCNIGVAF